MARNPTRRIATGAVRRAAKRQRTSNSRDMHLSAVEIGTLSILQFQWGCDLVSTSNLLVDITLSLFLRAHIPTPGFTAAIDQIVIKFCQSFL